MMWPELAWRRQYWSDRRAMLALVVVPPICIVLPLQRVFPTWSDGARAVTVVSAILLGMAIGKEAALPRRSLIWLYQKGISIPDHLLRSWVVDIGVGGVVIGSWTVAWFVGSMIHASASVAGGCGTFVSSVSAMVVVAALLFPLGAFNASRSSDFAGLLILISLLKPLIAASGLPKGVRVLVSLLLPPMFDAIQLDASILAHAWGTLMDGAIRISMFLTVMFALGVWRLSQWTGGDE